MPYATRLKESIGSRLSRSVTAEGAARTLEAVATRLKKRVKFIAVFWIAELSFCKPRFAYPPWGLNALYTPSKLAAHIVRDKSRPPVCVMRPHEL